MARGAARHEIPDVPLAFSKRAKRKERVYEVPRLGEALADTHAHLTCFREKDPVDVLVRASLAGVRSLVTLWDPLGDGIGLAAFSSSLRGWLEEAELVVRRALEQDRRRPGGPDAGALELFGNVRFLAGAHPYGAPAYTDGVHDRILEALADPRCAGIGEIGLDYHVDADDQVAPAARGVQMECMARQLAAAVERSVPVELHLRNDPGDELRSAHRDAHRVLMDVGVPRAGCVLHCFGEDRATMQRFVDDGCHIAFGGAATFKRNEQVREAFAACPLDRVLFETDCPYMAPEPIRGLECEPAMMAFTVQGLCRDRARRTGEDPAAIARAGWDNARRLFFPEAPAADPA